MSEQAASTTRHLLCQLAMPPTEMADHASCAGLVELAEEIQATIRKDQQADSPTVAITTLHGWRTRIDELLRDFEHRDPSGWAHARQPGTWLDNHLRLRSLLAHEVAKAYWDNRTAIDYASIDIERYLWGAR